MGGAVEGCVGVAVAALAEACALALLESDVEALPESLAVGDAVGGCVGVAVAALAEACALALLESDVELEALAESLALALVVELADPLPLAVQQAATSPGVAELHGYATQSAFAFELSYVIPAPQKLLETDAIVEHLADE